MSQSNLTRGNPAGAVSAAVASAPPNRAFNPLLFLGIFIAPYIFGWFMLRSGHTRGQRIATIVWAAIFVLSGVMTLSLAGANPSLAGIIPGYGLFTVSGIAMITALVVALRKAQAANDIAARQRQELITTYAGWDIYISPYNYGVLGLSRDSGEVVLGVVAAARRYPLSAVAAVEVLKDGASITQTNRGSQILGAAVGDLLLGPAGLLIGGLSGSRRTRATLHSVALKVIVDDRDAPVHAIEFFRSPDAKQGTDARAQAIQPSLQKAEHFNALMINALRAQARLDAPPSAVRALPIADTGDKIGTLWDLHQAGALTADEFAAAKAKLLTEPGVPSDQSR